MLDLIVLVIKLVTIISLFSYLGIWAFLVAPIVWRVL